MKDQTAHPQKTREAADAPDEGPRLNALLIRSLALYVADHAGQEVLDKMIDNAGIDPAAFSQKGYWVPVPQLEAFLLSCYLLVGNDEERFREACTYRIAEAFGPFRFVCHALSPATIMAFAAKSAHLVSTFTRIEVLNSSPRHMAIRYHSTTPESRLMCIHRQAISAAQPTLCGLPAATINESKCISSGHPTCEYTLHWYVPRRYWVVALGAAVGLLGAGGATLLGWAHPVLAGIVLPACGLFAALAWESVRSSRQNLSSAREQTEIVRHFINEDSEARRELLAIQERENAWLKKLEHQKEASAARLESLFTELQDSQAVKDNTARGLSHDLRTPLATIQMNTDYLVNKIDKIDADRSAEAAVEEISTATSRMAVLIGDFIRISQAKWGLPELNPQLLNVAELQRSLERRLGALTRGKGILPSVQVGPDAPDSFRCDPQVFDRILDNLLTNAAKHTVQGSIRVRFERSDDHCAVVVADTGCGIAPERIKQAFLPGSTAHQHRTPDSYGLGLSVTLQLLGQIGGRLEIASAPGKGTTIRVHFPLEPQAADDTARPGADKPRDPEQLFSEIVHVLDPKVGLTQF